MKHDAVYIKQILEAISKIESFTSGLEAAGFSKDQKTQSAVILQLLLIGEIAKKISSEGRSKIDLPWKEIAGFRDRAIHNYFEIDLDIVWQTLISDLPELKKKLKAKS